MTIRRTFRLIIIWLFSYMAIRNAFMLSSASEFSDAGPMLVFAIFCLAVGISSSAFHAVQRLRSQGKPALPGEALLIAGEALLLISALATFFV